MNGAVLGHRFFERSELCENLRQAFACAPVLRLVLGFALSLVLIYVINKQSFGWTIRFHWPTEILMVALTVVYAATVLAGFYPAQLAVRLNPLEVVHEE